MDPTSNISEIAVDSNPNPEENLEKTERIRILNRAVSKLSPSDRELFEMYKTYDCLQIAEKLNCSLKNVNLRWFRLTGRLRIIIEGMGYLKKDLIGYKRKSLEAVWVASRL